MSLFFILVSFFIPSTLVFGCSDLTNSATGVSDCASKAYLCSNSAYYSLMTVQCPKTCGRCSSSNSTSSSSSSSSSCADLTNPSTGVSDCPSKAYLCSNSAYYSLMTTQCPKTCGRCNSTSSSSSSSSSSSTCADLTNPSTGTSDCSSKSYLCNNSVYYTLMTTQCPKTCGRCSTSSSSTSATSTTSAGSCVDLTNPYTGTSDCPNRVAYCTNSAYLALMKVQCRKTCGFCS